MPVYQPFNVYREQLSSYCLGLALWDPAPNPSINDRVSIGDVGFVREGVFLRMFNVTLPHNHPSNKKIGEPDHYDPLDCGPFVNLLGSTLTKGDYPSRHVSTVESNPLAATPNDDEGLTYECPGIGALLSLPAEAVREDVLRTKVFEDYIRDNVASWFAWSQKSRLGVERMEDLILVTGCTLANSWAAAAFCDPTAKSRVSLSAQSHDGRVSFTWRNIHGFVIHRSSRHDPNNPQPAPNQCIFIKGFRAKRVFFRTRLIRAAAEPLPDDPDNRDEDEIQVTGVPYARTYRDPLVAVLDYIAEQCPEDTIAIAHDNDLDLIKDVEILTADAVEKFLHENQIPVLTENGAAILRDPEGPPVQDEQKVISSQVHGEGTSSTQPYRDRAYPSPSRPGGDASVQLPRAPSSFREEARPRASGGGGLHHLVLSRLARAARAVWSLFTSAPGLETNQVLVRASHHPQQTPTPWPSHLVPPFPNNTEITVHRTAAPSRHRVLRPAHASYPSSSWVYGEGTSSLQPSRDHPYPPLLRSGVQLPIHAPPSFRLDVLPRLYASGGGGSHPLVRSRSVDTQPRQGPARRSGRLVRAASGSLLDSAL